MTRPRPATLLDESLTIARELDDRWTVALALHHLGRVAYFDDDPATARALAEESLAIAEAVGDPWLIAWALHLLGLAAHIAADYPTARAYYARSLAIRQELGHQEGIGILFSLLGMAALREGELSRANLLLQEALAVMRNVVGPWGFAPLLAGVSSLAAALGQSPRAVPARRVRDGGLRDVPHAADPVQRGAARRRAGSGQTTARGEGLRGGLGGGRGDVARPGRRRGTGHRSHAAGPAPAERRGGPIANLTAAETQVLNLLADRPNYEGDRRRTGRRHLDGRSPPHPYLPEARGAQPRRGDGCRARHELV